MVTRHTSAMPEARPNPALQPQISSTKAPAKKGDAKRVSLMLCLFDVVLANG
jgi:hypothetical protein